VTGLVAGAILGWGFPLGSIEEAVDRKAPVA
jgi:hypothetical protein